ncbi:related to lactamase, beta 2 [Serendipita indica DSM 11827]|uniref:Related to lactamase, beta 2 n=1 Tax=Serendipita indica (strain DSM 11827) TaxID=1109443 RepID=G4TM59_SERID|nr:related to lactamase, beta 2 [Serendipita indica DSM 11827]
MLISRLPNQHLLPSQMASMLPTLPNVARLSERVLRVLGQNPGPYTLQGTNTYLVGKNPGPFVLIDTGEGRPEYIPCLKDALLSIPDARPPFISDILLTHKHRDHHGGLASVLKTLKELSNQTDQESVAYCGPRLHKFPLPPDQIHDHYIQGLAETLDPTLYTVPSSPTTSSPNEAPFHPLKDGQVLECVGATLVIKHTPGHTMDSVCIHLSEEKALFTADSVLGHGTAVFEDLSAYISSLQRLLAHANQSGGLQCIYPGHGPVLKDNLAEVTIQHYIDHRLERETQLVALMRSRVGPEEAWTVEDIVAAVYPENVRQMAKRGVLLHLDKLCTEGRVSKTEANQEVKWHILD